MPHNILVYTHHHIYANGKQLIFFSLTIVSLHKWIVMDGVTIVLFDQIYLMRIFIYITDQWQHDDALPNTYIYIHIILNNSSIQATINTKLNT